MNIDKRFFVKKKYAAPKLTSIGDMANNTLGASGNFADNGTFQASANGVGANGGGNNGTRPTTFDTNNFNNNGFDNSGF